MSIMKSLVNFPMDADIGLKSWILADKVIQQIGLQKKKLTVGVEKFDFSEVINSSSDRSELELMKTKYEELKHELDDEKENVTRSNKI